MSPQYCNYFEAPGAVQWVSGDVERITMQYLQVLTILTEIWNMFQRSRFPKNWILDSFVFCCFRWSVAQAKWRTACVKFLQWRFWQGEWWKSIDEDQSMTWVSSWPFIPCYAGHRPLVTKLTHVFVLAMYCCPLISCRSHRVFSDFCRSPMVQTVLCSNSRLAKLGRCTPADVSFLAGQTLFQTQPTAHKKEVFEFCNLED